MWRYTETEEGWKLLFDIPGNQRKDSMISGININLPYKQELPNAIIYWKEDTVQRMVDGLNDGSIIFDMKGLSFSLNLPEDFKPEDFQKTDAKK